MPLPASSRAIILPPIETLLIAAAGGIGFSLPAHSGRPGFGLGAGGRDRRAARAGRCGCRCRSRASCFVLIGILLGAVVTPETLRGMATWPLSVVLLAVATICMIAATTSYLRFVHGWDWLSAFLGASPGAMAQVVVLSAEFKADMRGVAIVQVMRVLLVTIGLPGGACAVRAAPRAR